MMCRGAFIGKHFVPLRGALPPDGGLLSPEKRLRPILDFIMES
jgi:hypothetical protein